MSELIYCATPSRLVHRLNDMIDLVTNQGDGPLHPFLALPYDRYEEGPVGRAVTMEFCLRLVNICDRFYMFGVSEGTMKEVVHAIGMKKPISLKFDGFDSDWKKFYNILGPKYGNPLDKLLNR